MMLNQSLRKFTMIALVCYPLTGFTVGGDLPLPPVSTNTADKYEAAVVELKLRLLGWPDTALINSATLPDDGREFLLRVASDTWRGMMAFTDRESGLPLDNVRFGKPGVDWEPAAIGDYTTPTNIGLFLIGLGGAVDLGLIERNQAEQKAATLLKTLQKLERHAGFFYNYYNTTSLQNTGQFVSFVDSAWLTAGLIATRQAFPALEKACSQLIAQGDYGFFYNKSLQQMSHGYFVDQKSFAKYHYGMLYSEARLGSLIAIGKGDVPPAHWYGMNRTLPFSDDWQVMQPVGRHTRHYNGFTTQGGRYRWNEYEFVPSWGGSMFEALMPRLVLDEAQYAPNSLGRNSDIHTTIQRRYALEQLGYPVWGMSPSVTPASDYPYKEYGIRMLGVAGYADGVVAPYAAALALLTEPKEATVNLQQLARRYPVYGAYGYYDAVNPLSTQVAYHYLALDQSMIFIALVNHLTGGSVQKRFSADPVMQQALPLIGQENFFD